MYLKPDSEGFVIHNGERIFAPNGAWKEWSSKTEMIPQSLIDKYLAKGWKQEQGPGAPGGSPWISFEHPNGQWMECFHKNEDGTVSKSSFNPTDTISLRVEKDPHDQPR